MPKKILNLSGFLLFLVFLFIATIGVFILRDTPDGEVYFSFFVVSSILFLILMTVLLVLNAYNKKGDELSDLHLPFADNLLAASFWFYIGVLLVPLFNLISTITSIPKTYSIVRPFAVFSSTGLAVTDQTFSVIQLSLSSFWSSFTSVIAAGVLETWIFNVVAVLTIVTIVFVFRKLFFFKLSEGGAIIADYIIAILVTAGLFMLAHQYNATYLESPILFIFAGLFMLLSNSVLYFLGMFTMLVVGFHMSNNAAVIGYAKVISDLFFSFEVPILTLLLWIIFGGMFLIVIINFVTKPREFFKKVFDRDAII